MLGREKGKKKGFCKSGFWKDRSDVGGNREGDKKEI